MRFGLRLPSFALGPDTASLADMGAYLRRAEDLGFESALLIDHLLVAPPAYRTTWLEPISLLSALSGVTRTMRLGTLVLVLPFRDPVAFAKEWATFDMLSGGRSILGVGVGWHPGEFAALRIPIKERGRRMNEMLEAITALWAGDDVSYEGEFYRFEGLTIDPKPAISSRMIAQSPVTISAVADECGTQVEAYLAMRRRTGRIVSTAWP